MFSLFSKKKKNNVTKEMTRLLNEMGECQPYTTEYYHLTEMLERLHKLSNEEKSRRVSPDTILIVSGNLAGILLVLNYEKLNIITSKAFNLIMKGRV